MRRDPEGKGFLLSQPRPWRPRPSINEVQRRHLVGDGKLRRRSVCEPGCEGVHAVTILPEPPSTLCTIAKGQVAKRLCLVAMATLRACEAMSENHHQHHLKRGLQGWGGAQSYPPTPLATDLSRRTFCRGGGSSRCSGEHSL